MNQTSRIHRTTPLRRVHRSLVLKALLLRRRQMTVLLTTVRDILPCRNLLPRPQSLPQTTIRSHLIQLRQARICRRQLVTRHLRRQVLFLKPPMVMHPRHRRLPRQSQASIDRHHLLGLLPPVQRTISLPGLPTRNLLQHTQRLLHQFRATHPRHLDPHRRGIPPAAQILRPGQFNPRRLHQPPRRRMKLPQKRRTCLRI